MIRKLIVLSLSFGLWCWCRWYAPPAAPACSVTVFDVGQGDAILIQTSDRQDILIDGGPNDGVVAALGRVLPLGDRDIELMVLTHPHADHVNGLVAVTERFTVRRVLESGVQYEQTAYRSWHELLRERRVPRTFARFGQQMTLGTATLDVLWPAVGLEAMTIERDDAAAGGGVNDASLVLRLHCGGSTAVLTGDASTDIEDRILDSGTTIEAGLLKVGHHGSRFSTSKRWLEAVRPRWAVISTGTGNRYHHPHPTTVLRLEQSSARILRTDVDGSIRLETDGQGGWRVGG